MDTQEPDSPLKEHAITPLREALADLAARDADEGASEMVERRLLLQVRRMRRARQWRRVSLATAAAIAFVAVVWRTAPVTSPRQASIPVPAVAPASATPDDFLPLPYANVPVSRGQIVRMPVAREALVSFGLDPGGPDASAVVLADVLIGEDGLARGVRFIDISTQEQRWP